MDARADLWALGVILFEMLSGERPFRGRSTGTVLSAILHRPAPSLAELCPDVPAAVVALLQHLLRKDPARRVQSARQVGAELEAIARELSAGRQRATSPERSRQLELAKPSAVLSGAELALRSSSHLRRVADRC